MRLSITITRLSVPVCAGVLMLSAVPMIYAQDFDPIPAACRAWPMVPWPGATMTTTATWTWPWRGHNRRGSL